MNENPSVEMQSHNSASRDQTINLLCGVLSHKASWNLQSGFSDGGWEDLVQIARQQGVSMLLYRRLKESADAMAAPEEVMKRLRESMLTAATRNMLMLREAGLILRELHGLRLDVIVLKGLYLVENIYRDISMRVFGDLDLLVRKSDLDKAIGSLERLGYRLETYYDPRDDNRDIKHAPPMKKPDGPYVEIHWTILEENEPFTIDVEGLWKRAVPAQVAGVEVLALGVEDLIMHLCVHLGYQHHLGIGLRGLYDIAEVLRHFKRQTDWKKVIEIAEQWGVERVIWLVLKLVEEMLGAEVPQEVYRRLVTEEVPEDLMANAREQLLKGEGQAVVMTPDLARLANTKGLAGRVKVMLSRVFLSRQVLARLYNVSPKSPAIIGCYFRRFRDLVKQYGPSLKPVLSNDKAVMGGVAEEEVSQRLKEWMGKQK